MDNLDWAAQVPSAMAVILSIVLFLKALGKKDDLALQEKTALQELHYKTINTLFQESDATNKELLLQLKETTVVLGQSMQINSQVSEVLEKVNKTLEKRDSDTKIDAKTIQRAMKELNLVAAGK